MLDLGCLAAILIPLCSTNPSAAAKQPAFFGLGLSDWAGNGEMVVLLPHNPQNDVQHQV